MINCRNAIAQTAPFFEARKLFISLMFMFEGWNPSILGWEVNDIQNSQYFNLAVISFIE